MPAWALVAQEWAQACSGAPVKALRHATLDATHKLHRMAWIRGIVGDARVERTRIVGKNHHPGTRREICQFVLRDPSPNSRLPPSVESDCDYWEEKQIGDLIELVDAGHGDVYPRDGGIYTSVGNFIVDIVLLAAELTTVIYFLLKWRRREAREFIARRTSR